MHPARSVIVFTTASGAGYGLIFWLALFGSFGLLPADLRLGLLGYGLGLVLVTAGLLSSMLHLGRPERAWRAMSQWRTSWLSREGLAALFAYLPVGLHAIAWVFLGTAGGWAAVPGLIAAAAAALTVACTAMIYASLRAVPAWRTPWTMAGYLALAAMSGAILLALLAHALGQPGAGTATLVAAVATVLGAGVKLGYWRAIDTAPSVSTAETATGLGTPATGTTGRVRMLDPPHTVDNYLMTEMGYRVARKHAAKLRRIAWIAAFALPLAFTLVALLLGGAVATAPLALATASMVVGLLIERWLFFAEARHVVTLYYGASAV